MFFVILFIHLLDINHNWAFNIYLTYIQFIWKKEIIYISTLIWNKSRSKLNVITNVQYILNNCKIKTFHVYAFFTVLITKIAYIKH